MRNEENGEENANNAKRRWINLETEERENNFKHVKTKKRWKIS